ncbi:MAG: FkbM family methyltransferase [Gemmataceae bacterium]|nr:FkbM family methyltransferase [Gemmataceae bacterium]
MAHSRYALRREPAPPEFVVLRHFIEPGCLVVDAGANIGLFAKFFSHYGPQTEVLCIEPIPTTFALLKNNVAALGLHNVRLVSCALSDHGHTVVMEIPEDPSGNALHALARVKYSDPSKPPLRSHFTVEARTLDDVLANETRRVCLVKCDVEMHELETIRGARELLRRDHPALYIEIQPDFPTKKSQLPAIIELLTPEGYSPFYFVNNQLVAWTAGATPLDIFFLTDEHLRRLAPHGIAVVSAEPAARPPM